MYGEDLSDAIVFKKSFGVKISKSVIILVEETLMVLKYFITNIGFKTND